MMNTLALSSKGSSKVRGKDVGVRTTSSNFAGEVVMNTLALCGEKRARRYFWITYITCSCDTEATDESSLALCAGPDRRRAFIKLCMPHCPTVLSRDTMLDMTEAFEFSSAMAVIGVSPLAKEAIREPASTYALPTAGERESEK